MRHPRSRLHNYHGSNQYQAKRRLTIYGLTLKTGTWKLLAVIFFFMSPVFYFGHQAALAQETVEIVSPLPMRAFAMEDEFLINPSEAPLADLPERERNIEIIRRIWRKDWKIGVEISRCEAGLRANAVNRSNKPPYEHQVDVGLFQIGVPVHMWTEDQMLDPIANAGVAYSLFKEQGFGPWESSKKCWSTKI